jgi:hypothetical protein
MSSFTGEKRREPVHSTFNVFQVEVDRVLNRVDKSIVLQDAP